VARKTIPGIGRPGAPAIEEPAFGSLPHASPEQLRGEPSTARSDVRVLASVPYECLVGSPPFARDAAGILSGEAEAPSRRAPGAKLPETLDGALLSALAAEPAARPATPAELAAAIWKALGDATLAAGLADRSQNEEPAPAAREAPPARRRGPVLLTAAALLALLFAGGWLIGRRSPARSPSPAATAATVTSARPGPSAPPATAAATTEHEATTAVFPRPPATPRPAGSRPEPGAPPATAAATAERPAPDMRVDDLKQPYR
jgi:hypothetical protein